MLLITIYNERTELEISDGYSTPRADPAIVQYAFKHLLKNLSKDEFKQLQEAINERRG